MKLFQVLELYFFFSFFQCFREFQNDSYIGEYEAILKDKILDFFNGSADDFLSKYAKEQVKPFLDNMKTANPAENYDLGYSFLNHYLKEPGAKSQLTCLKTKVHIITGHIDDCAEGQNTLADLVDRAKSAEKYLKNECFKERIKKEELTDVIKKVMIDRGLQEQCEKNKL